MFLVDLDLEKNPRKENLIINQKRGKKGKKSKEAESKLFFYKFKCIFK